MKVTIEELGATAEDVGYRGRILIDGEHCGMIRYDAMRKLFISGVSYAGAQRRFFHIRPDGITYEIEKWIGKLPAKKGALA